MAPDVSVVIGTFGNPVYRQLAIKRAIPSAERLGVPVFYEHRDALADARNAALDQVTTEYVVHLDADDELPADYLQRMGKADVQVPMVRYISTGAFYPAGYPAVAGHVHQCESTCLREGNYIVVGAIARTELVQKIRWKDWVVYEDWALWLECFLAGASFEYIPSVYLAHVRRDSRNKGTRKSVRRQTHYEIAKANMPDGDWEYLIA